MEKLRIQVSLSLFWIKWLERMQERTLSKTTSETIEKIFKEYGNLLDQADKLRAEHELKNMKKAKICNKPSYATNWDNP
jgi:hypothetical protein